MEFFRRARVQTATPGDPARNFQPTHARALRAGPRGGSAHRRGLFVLPRSFPHKRYEGATFEDRVKMLETAAAALLGNLPYSIASTEGGLFIEIARECREAYGPGVRLLFLCGKDAAERAANWDYGQPAPSPRC
jgi:hypothetical protein